MLLKVVIAEDDDIFRRELIKIVSAIDGFEIVYSTNNGKELFECIEKIKPQVIISDIDMPDMTGIEAIRAIRDKIPDTEIIFITSYEEYIKQAVELYACDFVEKPPNIERLTNTLERIKIKLISNEKLIDFSLDDGSVKLIKITDLCCIEALQKKTKLCTEDGVFICSLSLKEVEETLPKDIFFKTSRSYVVNLNKVEEIIPASRTSFQIVFDNKNFVAYLSKRNYEEFRTKIRELYR